MTTESSSDFWSDGLRLVSYCPVCETKYHPMEAQELGSDGQTRLLHVQCRKCRHSILALVLVNQVGASSVGLLTDLSYEDVLKFQAGSRVSVNDVIDLHNLLDGEIWQKIGQPRGRAKSVSRKEKGAT